jgi:D-tyrosyl-tRNA(Tyr) deacylase
MRSVVQRVLKSKVTINNETIREIGTGLLIFVGFEDNDTDEDIEWLSGKIIRLRIFGDTEGLMNRSVQEVNGDIMVISQFTLHASTKKGNRPSFVKASKPEIALPLYNSFIRKIESDLGKQVICGEFGADMKIELVNDGPVTIVMDTKNKE